MPFDVNLIIEKIDFKKSPVKQIYRLIAKFRKERKLIMEVVHLKETERDFYHLDFLDTSIRQMREDVAEIDERIRALETLLSKELERREKK